MLDVEEIRRHLQYMVVAHVSKATGVDRGTLIRLKNGLTKRPAHSVLVALSDFLKGLRDD
jgi:hypothetical protein